MSAAYDTHVCPGGLPDVGTSHEVAMFDIAASPLTSVRFVVLSKVEMLRAHKALPFVAAAPGHFQSHVRMFSE